MNYQPKTTVVSISVGNWTETTDCSLSARFTAAHAVAVQIALRCQMDIMSFIPYSLQEKGEECYATVIYVNNGRSFDEIQSMMQPEIDNKPARYWMIQDIYPWQGLLDCCCNKGIRRGMELASYLKGTLRERDTKQREKPYKGTLVSLSLFDRFLQPERVGRAFKKEEL